jgi:hypothetical protein
VGNEILLWSDFRDGKSALNRYSLLDMQWYYSKNGTQLGPVTEADLKAKLASGEVLPTDLVWKDGMANWQPASNVPELGPVSALSLAKPGNPSALNSPYQPPHSSPAPIFGGPEIPNYLWQSIVVTILCCWPFGIPAIVYAAKVDSLKSRGDFHGAMAASASAKTWCIVAAGIPLVLFVLWLLLVGSTAVFSSRSGSFP